MLYYTKHHQCKPSHMACIHFNSTRTPRNISIKAHCQCIPRGSCYDENHTFVFVNCRISGRSEFALTKCGRKNTNATSNEPSFYNHCVPHATEIRLRCVRFLYEYYPFGRVRFFFFVSKNDFFLFCRFYVCVCVMCGF